MGQRIKSRELCIWIKLQNLDMNDGIQLSGESERRGDSIQKDWIELSQLAKQKVAIGAKKLGNRLSCHFGKLDKQGDHFLVVIRPNRCVCATIWQMACFDHVICRADGKLLLHHLDEFRENNTLHFYAEMSEANFSTDWSFLRAKRSQPGIFVTHFVALGDWLVIVCTPHHAQGSLHQKNSPHRLRTDCHRPGL